MDKQKDRVMRWPLDGPRTAWESEKCESCDEFGKQEIGRNRTAIGCRQCDSNRGAFTGRHYYNKACCNWRPQVTLRSYQEDVMRTARQEGNPASRLLEAVVGATSEAGEMASLVKKWQFQGHDFDARKFIEESGDALFYIATGLRQVGSSLETAMQVNVLKRREIYPQGFDPERSKGRS